VNTHWYLGYPAIGLRRLLIGDIANRPQYYRNDAEIAVARLRSRARHNSCYFRVLAGRVQCRSRSPDTARARAAAIDVPTLLAPVARTQRSALIAVAERCSPSRSELGRRQSRVWSDMRATSIRSTLADVAVTPAIRREVWLRGRLVHQVSSSGLRWQAGTLYTTSPIPLLRTQYGVVSQKARSVNSAWGSVRSRLRAAQPGAVACRAGGAAPTNRRGAKLAGLPIHRPVATQKRSPCCSRNGANA
jgi:hypothetical protein